MRQRPGTHCHFQIAKDLIRKAIILTFAPVVVTTAVTLSGPAVADANVKDVTAACDRTAGCNYTIDKSGTISGCSKQSGACFTCGQDGKCQGIQPKKAGTGKGRPVNIGGVKISPAKTPPKTSGVTKVSGKNVSHDTAATNTNPQTKGPTNERRQGGGGARH